jgi:hypothetical protein
MRLDTYLSEEPDTGYQAYQEGRQAHRAGQPITINPYGRNNEESHQFVRGWQVEATVTRMGVS